MPIWNAGGAFASACDYIEGQVRSPMMRAGFHIVHCKQTFHRAIVLMWAFKKEFEDIDRHTFMNELGRLRYIWAGHVCERSDFLDN